MHVTEPSRARRLSQIGSNVLFLGLTSLLTDVSSEMVNAVLPLYLTTTLRFTPLAFGFFDGIYQGTSALVRLWGGLIADRRNGRKQVAAVGYATSAACKLGLLASGTLWTFTTFFLLLDRLGKGVRTAPRDALIALSSPRERWGEAFGVHRAMDTAGALIGPLLAFVLLARVPAAFDAVFVVSLAFGIVGLGVLLFFVRDHGGELSTPAAARDLRAAWALLGIREFRTLVVLGSLLSLATVSDAFVYLVVQRRADLDPSRFPLLPVAMTLAYLVLAIPLGRLADSRGRARVFLGGYGALAAAYALLAWPNASSAALFLSLPLLGTYYAATDGVLMALASQTLPPERLTTGMALLATGTVLARLLASTVFGAVWSWRGPESAVMCFLCALILALVVAGVGLRARA
jgi:MFS family permease